MTISVFRKSQGQHDFLKPSIKGSQEDKHWRHIKRCRPDNCQIGTQTTKKENITRWLQQWSTWPSSSVCDEGPGICAHLMTMISILLIMATLPFSLLMAVKVVQVSDDHDHDDHDHDPDLDPAHHGPPSILAAYGGQSCSGKCAHRHTSCHKLWHVLSIVGNTLSID